MASNIYQEFDTENPVNILASQLSQVDPNQLPEYRIPDSVLKKS